MTDDSGYEAGDEPKLNKIADLVDELAVEMKRQAEHNSQITPNIIKQIDAIQTLIYRP